MAANTIHVLNRSDYTKHTLVSLPSDPLTPLAPSSLRIRSKIIGLTTNNLTYARMGHLVGWWDVYPLPANTPAPYNDASTYGQISAWGHAEILESTVPGIPAGNSVFGYVPIGTLPRDVSVEQTGMKNQIFITSPHRQHLWKIYNRLHVKPSLSELEKQQGIDILGWDTLEGLFGTGYNMNRHAFAWTQNNLIHPSGKGEWTLADARLDDSTVLVLSASGKSAMAFVHQVQNNRPKEHQPRTIIGICSSASKGMVEKSGFYDKVALYDDAQKVKDEVEKSGTRRAVLLDFGARSGTRQTWDTTFQTLSAVPYTFISVGGEVKVLSPEAATARLKDFTTIIQVNASHLREKGIEDGGDSYFEEYYRKFDEFKTGGAIPSVELKWGESMEDWAKGWEGYCNDEIPASHGLVYRI